MAHRDVGAAVHQIRGQIAALEERSLDLMAKHTAALDRDHPAEADVLADEYEAAWDLKTQYEHILNHLPR